MNATNAVGGLAGAGQTDSSPEHRELKNHRKTIDEISDLHTSPATKAYGVVFVHGIGSQQRSMPLREQADPLIDWLRRWHAANGAAEKFKVWSSVLSYGQEIDGPARVYVAIPDHTVTDEKRAASVGALAARAAQVSDPAKKPRPPKHWPRSFSSQTWVLTEGYWAARVSAPSFRTMFEWALKAYWWAAARRLFPAVFRRSLRGDDPIYMSHKLTETAVRSPQARFIDAVSGVTLGLLYALAGVVAMPFLALLALIAQLPIPRLDEFVLMKAFRPLLVEGIGDFYTYMHDEVQALHIRRSITEAIRWLVEEERCRHVVVISQSGGALMAFDALGTRTAGACTHDVPAIRRVKGLVTAGSALNRGWDPQFAPSPGRRLADGLCSGAGHRTLWTDFWADHDPVCGNRIEPPYPGGTGHGYPDEDIKVTNGLNVLTDHGSYWTNQEEYLARIAQIVESPRERHLSRFWDPVRTEWTERRRDRVTTLVLWRTAALIAFGAAIGARAADGRLLTEGRALLDAISGIPMVGAPVAAVMQVTLDAPPGLQAIGAGAVGALLWVVICLAAYQLIVRPAYVPWERREGIASIAPTVGTYGQRASIFFRSLAVLGAGGVTANAVASLRVEGLTFVGSMAALGLVVAWLAAWWCVGLIWSRINSLVRGAAQPRPAPAGTS